MRGARVVGAGLLLVALVAGPPMLLVAFGADLLPRSWSVSGLWTALSGPDTGQVFLGVLAIAGVIAWLQLLAAFAVESVSVLRGRALPRIRGIRWAQAVTGTLLAIMFGAATATSSSAAAAPLHHLLAHPAAHSSSAVDSSPASSAPPATAAAAAASTVVAGAAAPGTYVVAHGDSLMRIAAEQLGDEHRYRELFDLNRDRPQADGHTLTDIALLRSGWVLQLPANDTAGPPGADQVLVRPGDTLSAIAEQHLGDPDRYPEVFDLNRGRPQPIGPPLTDPDLIRPGMVLNLPVPAAVEPAAPTPAPDPQPQPDLPIHAEEPQPAPPDVDGPTAPQEIVDVPDTPTADNGASGTQVDHQDAPDDDSLLVAGSVGALTAAGVLTILGLRRWHARRRRRPGHRMPQLHPTDLETTLHMAEDPATVALLDRSLRTLANHIRGKGRALPAIRSALVLASGGLLLHLVRTDETPTAPFILGSDGEPAVWTLDPAAGLLDEEAAADVPAPYPTLVTLGTDEAGNLVLANLEEISAIVIAGEPDDVEAVLVAMATDLAASSWADHLTATLIGVGHTIAAHLPDRLRYADTVDEVLDALARRTRDIADGLDAAGIDSVNAARGQGLAEDSWTPSIILSAHSLTDEQNDRLIALIDQGGPATGLAAVITGGDPNHTPTGGWHLDASTDPTPVEALGLRVRLQRLTRSHYQLLIAALASAEDTTQVPAEDWAQVPAEPATMPDPLPNPVADGPTTVSELNTALDPAAKHLNSDTGLEHNFQDREDQDDDADVRQLHADGPEIKILGQVHLVGVDPSQVEAKKLNRLTELTVYLALNPNTSGAELSRQLGTDDRPWSAATRQGYVSRLRTWLGRDHTGQNYVPLVEPASGYSLTTGVRCDWFRFTTLAQRGLREGPDGIPHLQTALSLVTGMPLTGIPIGRYAWASYIKQEMIDTIVDIAHAAATHLLTTGDLRAARTAIARGLLAEPVSELLYRDLIRIEYRGQNLAGVRAAADKLANLAQALDIELEPETSDLIHQALDPRYRATLTHGT